jgi:hypothetical protein
MKQSALRLLKVKKSNVMPGRSIAHAKGGERKFADEWQWNIINTKRKQ